MCPLQRERERGGGESEGEVQTPSLVTRLSRMETATWSLEEETRKNRERQGRDKGLEGAGRA